MNETPTKSSNLATKSFRMLRDLRELSCLSNTVSRSIERLVRPSPRKRTADLSKMHELDWLNIVLKADDVSQTLQPQLRRVLSFDKGRRRLETSFGSGL